MAERVPFKKNEMCVSGDRVIAKSIQKPEVFIHNTD